MNNKYTKQINCPICKGFSHSVLPVLEDTPLEDSFSKKPNNYRKIKLDTHACSKCGLLFLKTQVDPSSSYSEYLYTSATTVGLKSHFDYRAATLIDLYDIEQKDLIIDLGCNDGSFLLAFDKLGYKNLLGVEPSPNASSLGREKGINIQQYYFNKKWVDNNNYLSPKLITANYMFANIPNPLQFMKECNRLMDQESILSIETGFHLDQFKKNMIDYIYHEHFYYFTIKSLSIMAKESSLKISAIRQNNHKGGSIEVDFIKENSLTNKDYPTLKNLLIKSEEEFIKSGLIFYDSFNERILKSLTEIKSKLEIFSKKGWEIIAFGASHSTTTLLHMIHTSKVTIKCIIDDNKIKQNRYSPGFNLPVIDPSNLEPISNSKSKRLIILLAWQHSDSILKKHLGKLSENCWLIPFPDTKIVCSNIN